MSIYIVHRNFNKLLKCGRLYSHSISNADEYTETPQYPQILDLSLEKRKERAKQADHEKVRLVKTVEEKQIKLNMPKYWGFKCHMFEEHSIPYNQLSLAQYITRTALIEQDKLPSFYDNLNVETLEKGLKDKIEDILVLEYENLRQLRQVDSKESDELENFTSSSVCQKINRLLINTINEKYSHLADTQTDIDPRIESSWFVGGITPSLAVQKWRQTLPWMKEREKEPVDRAIQYLGRPSLTLRSKVPLQPVVQHEDADSKKYQVPVFNYDLGVVEVFTKHRRLVNTPGYWPGDPYEFGLISYHKRGHLIKRDFKDEGENLEAIYRQGILGGFSWLTAQANHLGFTTFNDITYPLATQCIVTNGKLWSFFVYQLNTMTLHSKLATENPKVNLCWATKELKLFEEIKDGKVIGLNEDVVKLLLKFYANAPQERRGVDLKPYLSKDEKVIADYADTEKRQWLEREYKHLTSNKPRHLLPHETYHWEKIYKIDHKTRPMDARRRPFELYINPWARTLDDRKPEYIPRAHRPHLPRHKGRNAKEYFP